MLDGIRALRIHPRRSDKVSHGPPRRFAEERPHHRKRIGAPRALLLAGLSLLSLHSAHCLVVALEAAYESRLKGGAMDAGRAQERSCGWHGDKQRAERRPGCSPSSLFRALRRCIPAYGSSPESRRNRVQRLQFSPAAGRFLESARKCAPRASTRPCLIAAYTTPCVNRAGTHQGHAEAVLARVATPPRVIGATSSRPDAALKASADNTSTGREYANYRFMHAVGSEV